MATEQPDAAAFPSKEKAKKSLQEETLTMGSGDKEVGGSVVALEGTTEYVSGVRLILVVGSVAFASFLILLDTIIISTAIPRITDTFNSLPDVGWYAGAYQFGRAAPQLLTGKVYTYFNSKWSFLAFFALFELGSVLCGAATSSNMLIVGRAIAGAGASGIINGAITIISSCAPLEKRPTLIGITMGFNQLGLVAGPLIGGAFTSYTTWRWCFYVNLPPGAVTMLALALSRVPEQTKKPRALTVLPKLHHHLDFVGCLLFAPAVLQLLLALQYGGNQYAWNSSQVIGLFCGSAATLVVWLLWNQHKGDDALLPPSLIMQRVVWSSALFQAFMISGVTSAAYYLPIYFQAVNNATPILSGVYLLPTIVSQLLAAILAGVLLQRIGFVIPLAFIGTVLLSVGTGLLALLQPGSPTGYWVGFQIIAGVGSGICFQMAIITIQSVVSPKQLAMGMAIVIFTNALGPAIVLVLCNVIFLSSLNSELRDKGLQADSAAIINAGATGFRNIVTPQELPGVLSAYANSLDRVFYLIAATVSACVLVLWGMGWHDLRKKKLSH